MSAAREDGGPAFPVAEDHKVAADLPWTCGMTLRDYFAAKALPGVMGFDATTTRIYAGDHDSPFDACVAKVCYDIADAMLKARSE